MILRPWPRFSTIQIFEYRTSNFSDFSPNFANHGRTSNPRGLKFQVAEVDIFFQKKLLVTFVRFGYTFVHIRSILDNFTKILILVKPLKNFLSDLKCYFVQIDYCSRYYLDRPQEYKEPANRNSDL